MSLWLLVKDNTMFLSSANSCMSVLAMDQLGSWVTLDTISRKSKDSNHVIIYFPCSLALKIGM